MVGPKGIHLHTFRWLDLSIKDLRRKIRISCWLDLKIDLLHIKIRMFYWPDFYGEK